MLRPVLVRLFRRLPIDYPTHALMIFSVRQWCFSWLVPITVGSDVERAQAENCSANANRSGSVSLRSGQRSKRAYEGRYGYRLDQMTVEFALPDAPQSFLLAPAGQSNECQVPELGTLSDPASHFVTVHGRHGDIQEHHLRFVALECFDRCLTVVDDTNVRADQLEQRGQTVGGIAVVIDDQDAARRQTWRPGRFPITPGCPPGSLPMAK